MKIITITKQIQKRTEKNAHGHVYTMLYAHDSCLRTVFRYARVSIAMNKVNWMQSSTHWTHNSEVTEIINRNISKDIIDYLIFDRTSRPFVDCWPAIIIIITWKRIIFHIFKNKNWTLLIVVLIKFIHLIGSSHFFRRHLYQYFGISQMSKCCKCALCAGFNAIIWHEKSIKNNWCRLRN